MRVKTLKTFKDKEKKKLRKKGEIFTCSEKRYEILKEAGVVEAVAETKEQKAMAETTEKGN